MVIITNWLNARTALRTARQQVYHALETESVALFRFECEKTELVRLLWFSREPDRAEFQRLIDKSFKDDSDATTTIRVTYFQLTEYTCHILNLFEMACRFSKQKIIPPDVFGSWVAWMWELCQSSMFQLEWKQTDMKSNYVGDLDSIIAKGVDLGHPAAGVNERKRFYAFVAEKMFSSAKQRQIVEDFAKP